MAGNGRRRGQQKKPSESETTVQCNVCDEDLQEEADALDCDLCTEYVCLKCTGIPGDLYNMLGKKDFSIHFICGPCKLEIPKIREQMGLKQKYESLQSEVKNLRDELATQEVKFVNQQANMDTLAQRLKTPEER